MEKKIAVLPGDGIGPEVVQSALKVLDQIADIFGHRFTYETGLIGGCAIDETGEPLPAETIELCKKSDAILLGAVGGPKWDTLPGDKRPEKGLLGLRKSLQLFANLRPVTAFSSLAEASTLKKEVIEGVDLMIVRELTGGIYFGEPRKRKEINGEETAIDTLVYSKSEIERIIRKGFELAELRSKKVTSVDKANVLESSRLWREVANEVAKDFPNIELEHMLVDNAAMQLIRSPKSFDVVVTENMFGDILSDEASMLTGSLGMLPSASLSADGPGLYEPIHGTAPDIAGKGLANPLATIASLSMMLKYEFGLEKEADAIQEAIDSVLLQGERTSDLAGGEKALSTDEMTEKVIVQLKEKAYV
ncbi:3-isopropylmalate dehydrogenase [Alkalihalobacillus alcalophilus ATCC 27647 = CGMCC 1.3604]|uniref:3-isopropylmalate dehydrogenase n=1 Tax=Alkalihalobacillus alcalophilus ATCC 27647 = CGMCC 1.3604 TaxID=1218173 RepID=A0A094WPZ1_ALKAL|nr:3-isopropylmalate dehydrogenase [Alkalihalobacillus alcalophilus]KGA98103.1 3-isopropylmalate dehydrogenase [Alkalihalobacillus alcalophilus ATCC 27647 = CGMCC 1.3604]MED1561440.1 3-isopropylmalate dehydrogenase [Alkalihalobacillus alcalophilus]THG88778.1 3-isopropylmalate dehydrogenase [Alkalihalobacillus alcalophilus ATCC 27647 = CGMCC 1.3604]